MYLTFFGMFEGLIFPRMCKRIGFVVEKYSPERVPVIFSSHVGVDGVDSILFGDCAE